MIALVGQLRSDSGQFNVVLVFVILLTTKMQNRDENNDMFVFVSLKFS